MARVRSETARFWVRIDGSGVALGGDGRIGMGLGRRRVEGSVTGQVAASAAAAGRLVDRRPGGAPLDDPQAEGDEVSVVGGRAGLGRDAVGVVAGGAWCGLI